MNCELSIIIPIYNTEKYLERCVRSVVSLYGPVFEVILVDDGSSDSSGELCDKFAYQYENIRVFHKSNEGVVSARNMGLQAAKGKYVTFVDADDWVREDFLCEAVDRLEDETGIDIVAGCMVRGLHDGSFKSIFPKEQEECILTGEDAREALFRREHFGWELCGKVYRKKLFDGWKADESVRICEDLDASWELFKRAAKVLYIPALFYYYFWNEVSVTSGYHYLEAKSYLVFERILDSCGEVSAYMKEALTDNYIKSLINLVRESYYQKRDKKEIEDYQKKLNAMCPMLSESRLQDVRAMCSGYQYTLDYLDGFWKYIDERFREIYGVNKSVYYWGTGAVSDYVSRIASQLGFACDGYIVSEGELRKKNFYGKKVLYLSDREIKRTDAIILLVKRESQEIIYENLLREGYRNIFQIDTMGVV